MVFIHIHESVADAFGNRAPCVIVDLGGGVFSAVRRFGSHIQAPDGLAVGLAFERVVTVAFRTSCFVDFVKAAGSRSRNGSPTRAK